MNYTSYPLSLAVLAYLSCTALGFAQSTTSSVSTSPAEGIRIYAKVAANASAPASATTKAKTAKVGAEGAGRLKCSYITAVTKSKSKSPLDGTMLGAVIDKISGKDEEADKPAKTLGKNRGKNMVRLDLPETHPSKLAIVSPDDTWFYIQDAPQFNQLGSAKALSDAQRIEIDVDGFEAMTSQAGKTAASKVFRSSGTYTFYLADNLETDPSSTFSMSCKLPITVATR